MRIMIPRDKLIWAVWGLMVLLAFFSSSPTDPEARAGLADPGYHLFRRYGFGVVSTWDVLLFGALFLAGARYLLSRHPMPPAKRFFPNHLVNSYFVFLIIAIFIGLNVTLFTQMSAFVFRDWFRAVLPVAYMILTYLLVVTTVRSREDVLRTWGLLEGIAVTMVFYGFYRAAGIVTGQIATLAPGGVPIILYSELAYFSLPLCVYFLTIWTGNRLGLIRSVLLVCMVGFILASTRRFTYVLLVANLGLALLIARRAGLLTLAGAAFRSRYILAGAAVALAALIAYLPDLVERVLYSIETINIWSESGFQYTGEFRLVQIENLFSNLTAVGPAWLTGFGVGPKWQVFRELPTTVDTVGSFMAFDAKTLSGGEKWLPYFHVPYFATLFRFGMLGVSILAILAFLLYRRYSALIRLAEGKKDRIVLTALATLAVMPVLVLGDTPTPVAYIQLAFSLGLLDAYRISAVSA